MASLEDDPGATRPGGHPVHGIAFVIRIEDGPALPDLRLLSNENLPGAAVNALAGAANDTARVENDDRRDEFGIPA